MNSLYCHCLELRVGLTKEKISAEEGEEIEVCAKILDGVLGPRILLDYVINAPRENLDLPEGREDSAIRMLSCTVPCIDIARAVL